ncbi:hypothetical protein [Thermoanaerobacter sp. RKWS2]|uniref:recombination directionality factor n=1 Tax=Thermoanaerobacter sp. RKWS2 TaxID=2983842 RepID=UPI0017734F39|nr:hypothetical protein [Thermoanaerobacter sp. RKWS2]UZQ81740.1 hypothetical protein OEI98_001474 [Thermoanaerobacter sp. RKWS2]HHY79729.1 hypothetical protein [Thermoanaerobacter sp.]
MIKGLSEIRKLPRIGKIHLGVKNTSNKNGGIYPTQTDYFVVEDKNTPREIVEKIKKIYGERPQHLNIYFFSDNTEDIFPQYLKRYSKGQLLCKGNGETAQSIDPKTNEAKEIPCLYKNCSYYQQKLCRTIGHLKFCIREIPGGFFQIDTSSKNSIIQINTAIDMIKQQNNGRIANIPLKLTLVPIQVQVRNENAIFKKTTYILNIYQDLNNLNANKENMNAAIPSSNNNIIFNEDDKEVPEDLFPLELPEENIEANKEENDIEIPEGFDIAEDEEDPFAEDSNQKSPKEMLVLDKFTKVQIKYKDYVMAIFLDSQNKQHNFIITNKDIYVDLNTAKKSGQNPVIYDYQTEDFEGYEVLMEYKKLV